MHKNGKMSNKRSELVLTNDLYGIIAYTRIMYVSVEGTG